MNKIISPLRQDMQGTAVADLQGALKVLLDRGPILRDDEVARRELSVELEREQSTQTYGGATRKLVGIFQETHHLEVRGEVDERTASTLNAVLQELGAFDIPPEVQRRVVAGRVTQEDQSPFKGAVALFHDSDQGSIRLGETTTDADGRYTIRYEALPGSDGGNARVAVLDKDGRTLKSSRIGAGPLQVVDLVVPNAQPAADARRVEGRIAFDHGAPAQGLTLRLYRLGFGGADAADRLAETKALEHGVYSLPYAAGGNVANLEVRAVDEAGNEVALTKIIRNAGERETLNLVAPSTTKPLAAEFTRLTDDFQPHIGDLARLRTARETAEQPDLTLLHESSGWDARLIATAVLATRLSAQEETGLPQDALYGLLRAGLPSDKLQLAQVSMAAFDRALDKARAAGIVQIDEAAVPQIRRDFETFSVNARLAVQAPGSQATYGQMLAKLDLNADEQKAFARLYLNHRGDAKALWDAAADAGLGAVVPKLQRQGKLAFLTTNNPDLTQKLQADLGDGGPQQLVKMGLYKKEKWLDLIDVVPAAFAGAANPKETYAEDMARRVRISYSTEVTWNMIDSGELNIEGGNENLSAVLRKAIDKGFKLGQTSIDPFLKANQDVFGNLDDRDRRVTTEMLKTLHRVYQITPGNDAMKALLSAGLLSAQDVLAYPLDVFLDRFGALFPSMEQALLVYRKAEQVSNITYSIFSLAKELDGTPLVFAMSGAPQARQAAKDELVKHFPTMESLFGSLDYCECQECRSVLSPAAYLVDLLQFLDRDPKLWANTLKDWKAKHRDENGQELPYPFRNTADRDAFLARWHASHPAEPDPDTERTPYDVLIERRPDLPHIALTCENTNTALPQIDLVNEILEYYVANNKLRADAVRDTVDVTTAELLAEPQHVISEAYAALESARYPLGLPFDRWIETGRAFSAYFEVPLWQLLETFRQSDDLFAPTETCDRAAVFYESLGLSPAEVAIFTNPDPLSEWFRLYGFETAAEALDEATDADSGQRTDLNSAKALARRLGVTYQEITAVVQTAFVNPALSRLALLYKLGATIADARTYTENKVLYDQNEDLVGKRRADLEPADQQRFDALTKKLDDRPLTAWDVVNEVAAFERRLSDLATAFNAPLNELQAAVQAIPVGRVLVLAAPDAGCDFDRTLLQYADGKKVDGIALLRINLFVRLWRKLGWSIEETDRALTTFTPTSAPFDDDPVNLSRRPLRTALIYLAHLKTLDQAVNVGKQSRMKLLTLWSPIPTTGEQPLYAQLFLTHSARRSAEVELVVDGKSRHVSPFDDALGRYLDPAQVAQLAEQVRYEVRLPGVKAAQHISAAAFAGEARIGVRYDDLGEVQYLSYVGALTGAERDRLSALAPSDTLTTLLRAVEAKAAEFQLIKGHLLVLQGALGVTAAEISAILEDAGTALDDARLTLPNVSTLYRYTLLARALQLSIPELITLRTLSGLDPFKPLYADPFGPEGGIVDDYPFSQTVRFVEVVEGVNDSALKAEDLDYLLCHRFDESGKYRLNRDATLAWLKALADGARAIQVEQAAPADPGSLSEDLLRQKLGLVLPTHVVERFFALMNGTAEFSVTQAVAAADQLHPSDFGDRVAPAIRVSPFNAAKLQQTLVLRGTLSDDQKAALEDQFSGKLSAGQQAAFSSLLDSVQKDAKRQIADFFSKNLQKQALNDSVARGFLEQADFDLLLLPPSPNKEDMTEDQKTAVRKANESLRTSKLHVLSDAFFPFLQRRLIRQFLVQQVVAYTAADPVLVESLFTDVRLLATSTAAPVLAAFEALGQRGVGAAFFASNDLPDDPKPMAVVASVDTALKDALAPNSANSARFEGALVVPTPGAYRFMIELEEQGAEAELRFEHLPTSVFLQGVAGSGNTTLGVKPTEFLDLKPGLLYRFTLTLKNLAGGRARMLVEGETLAKDDLSQLSFYPASALNSAEDATLLLSKALQLTGALGLSEREIRYVLTHAEDFGKAKLSDLPVRTGGDDEKRAILARFDWFLRLAAYARMKRDLAGGTDDLIGVFEANGAAYQRRKTRPDGTNDLSEVLEAMDKTVYPLIARLTRRDEETVKVTARALARVPAFASEQPLERLWKALQVVERFGVPVVSLLEWTRIVSPKASAAKRSEIASDVKEAIKARFEPETWLRVAQPIFDKLRQRQRDALVAHVMHQNGFSRIEQLFEFFLIDPGVEPVVQTSRIRSAIGAIQIFIHRCLLNLEPGVSASAINSKQWQWMKRYPVWAGNRKLWLFPENVLEPEFRDDKTHLFAELEGKLLQSDVSNDVAEDAFFTYLKKLDELARLDIVAMYCEESSLDPASNLLHVIGRTYLEPYRYFYRRYAHDMWTPWEPMAVEIEGNHIVPVVWRDRLNVFWVTFIDNPDPDAGLSDDTFDLEAAEVQLLIGTTLSDVKVAKPMLVAPSKENPSGKNLTELSLGQLAGGVRSAMTRKLVKVQLHWSEYFQGEWSVRESGGYSASLIKNVSLDFDSATVFIHATKEFEGNEERGVRIHLGGAINQAFRVVSRNSRPTRVFGAAQPPAMPYNAPKILANRYGGSGAFKVTFNQRIETEAGKDPKVMPATPSILQEGVDFTVLPCANTVSLGTSEVASLVSPFFYQDDHSNTFFVQPTFKEKTIEEWQEWVTRTPQPEAEWDHPDWWGKLDIKPLVPKPKLPTPVRPEDPMWKTQIDPRARFELTLRQDWLVNPKTLIQLDGELVGAAGRSGLTVQPAERMSALEEAAPAITVNAGSAISSGTGVIATDTMALAAAGLSLGGAGLNIIGGTGLNSALLKNTNRTKGI
jgi:hypothetical protein